MASANKASGEAKLLLVLGLIVLLGGGALLGIGKISENNNNPPAPTPTPTPVVRTKEQFDSVFKKARHVKGDANAPITVIEFADFECPSCRRAFNAVLHKMMPARPVRLAFIHLPLPQLHARAIPSAIAAEAAAKQGKFWEMYDQLFTGPEENPDLSNDVLVKAAGAAGLDVERFKRDVQDPALKALVDADTQFAQENQVQSTPTFMILGPQGEVRQVTGGGQLDAALKEMEAKLGGAKPSAPTVGAPGPSPTAPVPAKP